MPSGFTTPAGGGGAQTLAQVLVAGGDPSGNPVTGELTVNTGSGTGQALELTGTRTTEQDILRIDYPRTVYVVDSDGVLTMSGSDGVYWTLDGTSDNGSQLDLFNHPTLYRVSIAARSTSSDIGVSGPTFFSQAGLSTLLGVYTAVNAAAPDVNINPGLCAMWFDQTDGAAKLMLKAKTADGTVVTAAIALA